MGEAAAGRMAGACAGETAFFGIHILLKARRRDDRGAGRHPDPARQHGIDIARAGL
jgi:hypothetical protein